MNRSEQEAIRKAMSIAGCTEDQIDTTCRYLKEHPVRQWTDVLLDEMRRLGGGWDSLRVGVLAETLGLDASEPITLPSLALLYPEVLQKRQGSRVYDLL